MSQNFVIALRDHAHRVAAQSRNTHRGVVVRLKPLVVEPFGGENLLEQDDDFILGGWATFFHQKVGIQVGDNVLLHYQDDEWVLFDVISDNDMP